MPKVLDSRRAERPRASRLRRSERSLTTACADFGPGLTGCRSRAGDNQRGPWSRRLIVRLHVGGTVVLEVVHTGRMMDAFIADHGGVPGAILLMPAVLVGIGTTAGLL